MSYLSRHVRPLQPSLVSVSPAKGSCGHGAGHYLALPGAVGPSCGQVQPVPANSWWPPPQADANRRAQCAAADHGRSSYSKGRPRCRACLQRAANDGVLRTDSSYPEVEAMAATWRAMLHIRLSGQDDRAGEIPLAELARVAEETQRVVTRIARGMIDDRGPGRLPRNASEATTLFLVGLRSGSTILDIALPESAEDILSADEGMPIELGEMALTALTESLELLSRDEPAPVLPVGVDDRAVQDIDGWLRTLRGYQSVAIDAEFHRQTFHTELVPKEARKRLQTASSQPSIPYVSADHQALTGRLYALNLRTGTFRIEDDARHSIRLTVPEDMRSEASLLINMRVRAIGNASLDERRRLLSFRVAALEQLPDLIDQRAFFERHELINPQRSITTNELTLGVITDIPDDEIDSFMAALED